MAKNVKINGVTYEHVPQVEIPNAEGDGTAVFYDTAAATAQVDHILAGKTAYGTSGEMTGAMVDNGAVTASITEVVGSYTVPKGYHNGNGTVGIAPTEKEKLIAGNLRNGVTVLGVTGKGSVVDTEDATASAGTIVSGKTAYVNGVKVTGSLTSVSVSQDSLSKVLTIE